MTGCGHCVGHPRGFFVLPPYAPIRVRRGSRENLPCCCACQECHGACAKRDRMFSSQTMTLSIRTLDLRCLIFPCKIPANYPCLRSVRHWVVFQKWRWTEIIVTLGSSS